VYVMKPCYVHLSTKQLNVIDSAYH